MSDKNPYQRAAGAYGSSTAVTVPDGRMLEGTILLKSAQKLEELAARFKDGEKVDFREVGEILMQNQKIWVIFVDGATDPNHALPQEIRNNIASLAVFIFNRTKDLMIEPSAEKMQILININRNIAGGLMKRQQGPESAPPPPPSAQGKETADSFA